MLQVPEAWLLEKYSIGEKILLEKDVMGERFYWGKVLLEKDVIGERFYWGKVLLEKDVIGEAFYWRKVLFEAYLAPRSCIGTLVGFWSKVVLFLGVYLLYWRPCGPNQDLLLGGFFDALVMFWGMWCIVAQARLQSVFNFFSPCVLFSTNRLNTNHLGKISEPGAKPEKLCRKVGVISASAVNMIAMSSGERRVWVNFVPFLISESWLRSHLVSLDAKPPLKVTIQREGDHRHKDQYCQAFLWYRSTEEAVAVAQVLDRTAIPGWPRRLHAELARTCPKWLQLGATLFMCRCFC